jgi:hypothetical protein
VALLNGTIVAVRERRPGRSVNQPFLKSFSQLGELARDAATPFLDHPIRVIPDPFRQFNLAVHDALLRREALAFKIQSNLPAAGRLVDHADSENKLDHGTPKGWSDDHSESDRVYPWAFLEKSFSNVRDYFLSILQFLLCTRTRLSQPVPNFMANAIWWPRVAR